MSYEIFNEDCLSGMSKLADGSVDAIICDCEFPARRKFQSRKFEFPK